MLALSATCLVHATTSSFHLSVSCWPSFLNRSGAGAGVSPTSGTFCTNVPSVLPGFNPAFRNWSSRYLTVKSSPFVPGARPSYSSDDSTRVWRNKASESMSERRPIGTCRDGDVEGGGPVGCGFDSDEHAATRA